MTKNISVSKKNNSYLFKDNNLGYIEIYVLKKPIFNAEKKFLLKTNNRQFTIEETFDYRPYFLIKYNNQEKIIAERTLPIEGMINFRDLGGYKNNEGKIIKWGKLYRSGHIHNATEKGRRYIDKLGINTIIDFRSDDEVMKYPNPNSSTIISYNLDPNAHAAELSAQFTSSEADEDLNLVNKIIEQKENETLENRYDIVEEQYRNFVLKKESQSAFKRMIEIIGDTNSSPILQHCRGGKDRTGFGAMLILGILGISDDTIIYDYMLTEQNRIERNRTKMQKYLEYTNDQEILNYLSSLIETKKDFIEIPLNLINNRFNGIEEYVKKELNIKQETINNIRQMYLYE